MTSPIAPGSGRRLPAGRVGPGVLLPRPPGTTTPIGPGFGRRIPVSRVGPGANISIPSGLASALRLHDTPLGGPDGFIGAGPAPALDEQALSMQRLARLFIITWMPL